MKFLKFAIYHIRRFPAFVVWVLKSKSFVIAKKRIYEEIKEDIDLTKKEIKNNV